jgi:hypothetical protein
MHDTFAVVTITAVVAVTVHQLAGAQLQVDTYSRQLWQQQAPCSVSLMHSNTFSVVSTAACLHMHAISWLDRQQQQQQYCCVGGSLRHACNALCVGLQVSVQQQGRLCTTKQPQ